MRGAVVAPANRDGRLVTALGAAAASMRGQFAVPAARNGRVSAVLSGVTAQMRGSFSAINAAPIWSSGVDQSPTVNVPFSLSLDSVCSDPQSQPITYSIMSGALPAGLAQSGARGQTISGTPTALGTSTIRVRADDGQADSASQDWAERSTQPGVIQAIKLTSQAAVDALALNEDGTNGAGWTAQHVVYDTSRKASGAGSVKFNVLNTDGTDSGALRIYLSPSHALFGPGQNITVAWSQYLPTAFCQTAFPGTSFDVGKADGFKHAIISQFSNSNAGQGTIVVQNQRHISSPLMYYYADNSGGQTNLYQPYNGGADYRLQNAINNASIADPSGNLTYPNSSRKYGPTYAGFPVQTGAPDPNNGGFVYVPNAWHYFMIHIRVGTYGTPNTLIEMWGQVFGQAPRLVHKWTNVNYQVLAAGGLEAVWLLPYNSLKIPGVGFDTFTNYDEILMLTTGAGGTVRCPGGWDVTLG